MMMEEDEFDPTLKEVINTKSLQWIFVGGKGGVGKTTTACSIAIQLAARRESVLILSTDPAHNLSDAFSQKFSNVPIAVKGFSNLHAMEIEATFEPSGQFRMADGLSQVLPELMASLPGVDEAFSFAELMNAVQSMQYSCIVFDTAPTGHTLRLLSFPDLLEKALKKLASLRDKMQDAFSLLGMINPGISEDAMLSKFDALRAVTNSVREAFTDPSRTTFVCVCIPEFLSVYETERLVQELARQNIDCSNIVVNQVLFPVEVPEGDSSKFLLPLPPPSSPAPPEATPHIDELKRENDRLRLEVERLARKAGALEAAHLSRRRMQSKYLSQVRDLYALDFHVVCVPLQSREVRGVESLRLFGELLYEPRQLPLVEGDDDE